MIKYVSGNIFETDCDCIINPVNSVGVMGGGLARAFIMRYPEPCKDWNKIYNPNALELPKFYSGKNWRADKDIIMFPTKIHYKNSSTLDYIETSLIRLQCLVRDHEIKSLAMPAVGCGLGGLDWDNVKELIEYYFNNDVFKEIGLNKLEVYEPQ